MFFGHPLAFIKVRAVAKAFAVRGFDHTYGPTQSLRLALRKMTILHQLRR